MSGLVFSGFASSSTLLFDDPPEYFDQEVWNVRSWFCLRLHHALRPTRCFNHEVWLDVILCREHIFQGTFLTAPLINLPPKTCTYNSNTSHGNPHNRLLHLHPPHPTHDRRASSRCTLTSHPTSWLVATARASMGSSRETSSTTTLSWCAVK